ncbi:MAG: DUF1326 domain-containing protein [Haloarculaceae archaeon]
MAEAWSLTGDYLEACNCDVACQCIWLEEPDDGACTASLGWHVREGQYGDVDLSGLSVGMLIATEEGVMFGPGTGWDVVLVIDEAADDDQRAAIEDIFTGQAGGIWAAVADTHVQSAEVVTAPIEFSRDGSDFAIEIGDVTTVKATVLDGFNEEPGRITPHPLTSDFVMNTGKSSTATASYDEDFSWDVSEGNAYLGDFELAGS